MEWLVNKGEIYHRSCGSWSTSIASGCCEQCAAPIPETTLRLVQDQANDRARLDRVRDVQKSLKTLTRRFAETAARADAIGRSGSAKS